jgi:exosortase
MVLLYYPALVWLLKSWAVDPYYTHGYLILPVSVLLAWRQWRHVRSQPREGRGWAGLLLIAISLGLVVWAMRWQDQVVVSFTLVALILGVLLYLEGVQRTKPWLFPVLFLAFMVPLPFIDLASPLLERLATSSATGLARLFGIAASHHGGEITLPSTTLVVGAPCSGLRSLVAMITLGVGWVYVIEGRLIAKIGMLVAIVPLVLISNIVRIFVLLVVAVTLGETAALTYYHDWSSPILFLLSLALLLVLGKVVGCSELRRDIF